MDIKNLYTFKTIIEAGSFIQAASVLGYTQSTITFQVRQLERELGITLFEKIGRRMVLTQAGENIVPYVRDTIEAYEKMKNVGKDCSELCGELNIILSETIFCYKMQPAIREFHAMAPHIKLKMRSLSCQATKQALLEGAADLGICYDESEADERLAITALGHCRMELVASRQLVEEMGMAKLDFTQESAAIPTSFITDEPGGIFRSSFETYLKQQNIAMEPTIELWSTETIKSMVLAGIGIAYLPQFVLQNELDHKELVALPHHISYAGIRAIYCYHKNKYVTPQMKLLMNLLQKHVGRFS